ncbi:TIGR01777 family protein [Patescibacteria group bacterium]|nr:TIGR01777 family protein [Patescibacteria group bacterium]
MKVIITGGSGFIGSELTAALLRKGYEVAVFDLRAPKQKDASAITFLKIDLSLEPPPPEWIKGADAVIHLAGRNIFGRWNKAVKHSIYQSRIAGTKNMVLALKAVEPKPRVLVSASAVGIYGDRDDEELYESSLPGDDFLARLCIDWEGEARKAEALGLRTVQIRTAPVLGHGGLLNKLLPIYKLGLGGPIGSGFQWFPWIHIHDIVGAYIFAVENEIMQGPVNSCSPQQIRNKEFSKYLANVLRRPDFLRVPSLALKIILNDLADFITASQKVYPKKLMENGYHFNFPDIKAALEDILGRP